MNYSLVPTSSVPEASTPSCLTKRLRRFWAGLNGIRFFIPVNKVGEWHWLFLPCGTSNPSRWQHLAQWRLWCVCRRCFCLQLFANVTDKVFLVGFVNICAIMGLVLKDVVKQLHVPKNNCLTDQEILWVCPTTSQLWKVESLATCQMHIQRTAYSAPSELTLSHWRMFWCRKSRALSDSSWISQLLWPSATVTVALMFREGSCGKEILQESSGFRSRWLTGREKSTAGFYLLRDWKSGSISGL